MYKSAALQNSTMDNRLYDFIQDICSLRFAVSYAANEPGRYQATMNAVVETKV